MVRLFEDDFETGDLSKWAPGQITAGETVSVASISPFKGVYHADFECDGLPGTAGEMSFVQLNLAGLYDVYARLYVKFVKTLPPVGTGIIPLNLRTALASGYGLAYIQVRNDVAVGPIWRLYWVDQTGSYTTATAIPVALDTWYCIELRVKVGAGDGAYEFWVNGQPALPPITGVDNLTPRTTSPFLGGPINYIHIGERWADVGVPAHGIFIDNFVLADTYIGPELPPPLPPLCPTAVIATAVYGPSIELNILRSFRDTFMARNSFGCWLSRTYYRVGKYIARWLINKEHVKTILKGYLSTIIKIVKNLT